MLQKKEETNTTMSIQILNLAESGSEGRSYSDYTRLFSDPGCPINPSGPFRDNKHKDPPSRILRD